LNWALVEEEFIGSSGNVGSSGHFGSSIYVTKRAFTGRPLALPGEGMKTFFHFEILYGGIFEQRCFI